MSLILLFDFALPHGTIPAKIYVVISVSWFMPFGCRDIYTNIDYDMWYHEIMGHLDSKDF